MVNFLIQINYLVLVFVTQVAAGKIVKSLNDTQNDLAKSGANVLAVNSTNHTELAEARDNYSYYYGRISFSLVCSSHNFRIVFLQLAGGLGTFLSIFCSGSCSTSLSTFSDLFPDIKFSTKLQSGTKNFDNLLNR